MLKIPQRNCTLQHNNKLFIMWIFHWHFWPHRDKPWQADLCCGKPGPRWTISGVGPQCARPTSKRVVVTTCQPPSPFKQACVARINLCLCRSPDFTVSSCSLSAVGVVISSYRWNPNISWFCFIMKAFKWQKNLKEIKCVYHRISRALFTAILQ